jgi:hypothetical protein
LTLYRLQASPHICRLAEITTPKRVRHPTDCSFASGCSPPHLAVTQLPPATGVATPSPGADFHLTNVAPSRAHIYIINIVIQAKVIALAGKSI